MINVNRITMLSTQLDTILQKKMRKIIILYVDFYHFMLCYKKMPKGINAYAYNDILEEENNYQRRFKRDTKYSVQRLCSLR